MTKTNNVLKHLCAFAYVKKARYYKWYVIVVYSRLDSNSLEIDNRGRVIVQLTFYTIVVVIMFFIRQGLPCTVKELVLPINICTIKCKDMYLDYCLKI